MLRFNLEGSDMHEQPVQVTDETHDWHSQIEQVLDWCTSVCAETSFVFRIM